MFATFDFVSKTTGGRLTKTTDGSSEADPVLVRFLVAGKELSE
jgi:hypothetical protein